MAWATWPIASEPWSGDGWSAPRVEAATGQAVNLLDQSGIPPSALFDVGSWWSDVPLSVSRWFADELEQANTNVTISATPGNAVADGVTAAIDQKRSIGTATGNAVANGATAAIDAARVIGTATGNAVADGTAATVNAARVISTGVGNAVADGVTSTINQARTVLTTTGNAVADGISASITNSTDVVISTTPGNAVADGVTASIVSTTPPGPNPAVVQGGAPGHRHRYVAYINGQQVVGDLVYIQAVVNAFAQKQAIAAISKAKAPKTRIIVQAGKKLSQAKSPEAMPEAVTLQVQAQVRDLYQTAYAKYLLELEQDEEDALMLLL